LELANIFKKEGREKMINVIFLKKITKTQFQVIQVNNRLRVDNNTVGTIKELREYFEKVHDFRNIKMIVKS
jgi:hypothetical protein